MMNDTDQPAADTAESWAAQLGLPSAARLEPIPCDAL
jgi:hypothetical protein